MSFFSAGSIAFTTTLPGFAQELIDVDFNGDGLNDLLSARLFFPLQNAAIPIEVLLNQGNGTFAQGTDVVFPGGVPSTTHPRKIVTADFNGDGEIDFFIADHGYDALPFPGAQNQLLLSSGSTYVSAANASLPAVIDFTHSATVADIDGDGDQDLYVGNLFGQDHVPPYFLINNGLGVFTRDNNRLPTAIASLDQNRWATSAFGDFNNDGHLDLFLGSDIGNASVLLMNDGAGTFLSAAAAFPQEPFGIDSIAVDSTVVDLNNDGWNDLVVAFTNNYTAPALRFWINQDGEHFVDETAQRIDFLAQSSGWLKYANFADFNSDGAMDIITEPSGGATTSEVLINNGDGYFFHPTNGQQTFTGGAIEVGDFNGDGRPDIATWGLSNLFLFTLQDGPSYPLLGDSGDNTLNGDAHANTMSGGDGNDLIRGGAGNDLLDGGSGADTLIGGTGSDTLIAGTGSDTMGGGNGNDSYVVDNIGDVVTESASEGADTVQTALTFYQLSNNVENLTFTATVGLNVGFGDSLDNVLTGSSGSDSFTGNFGNDTFIAGDGDDYLYIDHLDLSVTAGSGFDAIFIQDNAGTNLNLAAANVEWVYAWIGNDALDATGSAVGVSLVGEAGADVLRGSAQTDYIYIDQFDTLIDAGDGFDALFVYQGNGQGVINTTINVATTNAEWVLGGAGNDIITNFGDATSVTLSGGDGNDTITGGLANDFLYGNAGADTFKVTSNAQFDAILDFHANVDKVDLTAILTIQDFADLQAAAFDDGSGNTIFSVGGGNQLFLYQVALASLDANDFIF